MKVGPARRILDFVNDGKQHCNDTVYAPNFVRDSVWGDKIYLMGGHIFGPNGKGLADPLRFADRIWLAKRMDLGDNIVPWTDMPPWSAPRLIIGKELFPWMHDEEWLAKNIDSVIGCAASPAVVKFRDTYYMAFCATVNDPNCCTGEHIDVNNQYGNCLKPWGYFVLYWAMSSDGIHWKLVEPPTDRHDAPNIATRWSLLYYPPQAKDMIDGGVNAGYKGIYGVSMMIADYYWYLSVGVWCTGSIKNCLVRIPISVTERSDVGWKDDPEIFDPTHGKWERCVNGRLPSWVNDDPWPRGVLFGSGVNQITTTTRIPGKRALGVLTGRFVASGSDSQLATAVSDDLMQWTSAELVEGAPPSVLNPIYFEDAAGAHFAWAAQGDPPCTGGPYFGLSIWQADVE